jgi:hypothetical protein
LKGLAAQTAQTAFGWRRETEGCGRARRRGADAQEVEQVAAEVVEDLHAAWAFGEEDLRAAAERLNVGVVFGKQSDQATGQPPLAADVGKRSDHGH